MQEVTPEISIRGDAFMQEEKFNAAMYLRLSRDDASDRAKDGAGQVAVRNESESIGNQRELIRSFIHEQTDITLYDIYIDDGYSGGNFDRPEFKRMMHDIEAGQVNCVIVKDLSRFGRDYIESGRYIQKIFPALGVRFIALTDCYDSLSTDAGAEAIVLPIKNFINDSYCRDISTKVKSGLEMKRRNGEFISSFAVYGYKKEEGNRNHLVADEYAARIVRKIYAWKIAGMAVSAIADRLNGLGVLSPREYKKSMGLSYNGGFRGAGKSLWGNSSVKRILTNEIYLGRLQQGKSRKINYKLKKSVEKPREEWVCVENTHEALVTEDDFRIVQNLLKADSRQGPGMKRSGWFAGLLFCGDCGEQMVRRVIRYHGEEKVYYICSTRNRGEGCSRHSVREEVLRELVECTVKKYANASFDGAYLMNLAEGWETDVCAEALIYEREQRRLKAQQDRYYSLCAGLSEDLKGGIITREEYEKLHDGFEERAGEAGEARKKQKTLMEEACRDNALFAEKLKSFQDCGELREIDRHTLSSHVKRIYVYENRRIEIDFFFKDPYRTVPEGTSGYTTAEMQKHRCRN